MSTHFWTLLWILLTASAAGPAGAQASSVDTLPRIVGTSVHLEDLQVTVAWPTSLAASAFELVVMDADRRVVAMQPLQPTPGSRTHTPFADFFQHWPQRGPQFFAVVRHAEGSEVTQRHPWRTVLDCPRPTAPCRWATQDGLYTNALSLGHPLRLALDSLATEDTSDLLTDLLEQRPNLRGPIFSLATQLDQLDQRLDLEDDCFCAWYHTSSETPGALECDYQGHGEYGGTGMEEEAFWGPGARALAAGQVRYSPYSLSPAATASSAQTMELHCWKVHHWHKDVELPLAAEPDRSPQTLRFPIIERCQDACRGTVTSSASLIYALTTGALQAPQEPAVATARVHGSVTRDTDAQPPQIVPWGDQLQWTAGSILDSRIGWFQFPEERSFVDQDVRRVTLTLTGTAEATVAAEDIRAWAFGKATFLGGSLQMRGQADCALLPAREAELETWNEAPESDDCGEPLIEPWED